MSGILIFAKFWNRSKGFLNFPKKMNAHGEGKNKEQAIFIYKNLNLNEIILIIGLGMVSALIFCHTRPYFFWITLFR